MKNENNTDFENENIKESDKQPKKKQGMSLKRKILMPIAGCVCVAILAATVLPFALGGNGGASTMRNYVVTQDELLEIAEGVAFPSADGTTVREIRIYGDKTAPRCAIITAETGGGTLSYTVMIDKNFTLNGLSAYDELSSEVEMGGAIVFYEISEEKGSAYARFVLRDMRYYVSFVSDEPSGILDAVGSMLG